ncbi:hypothetical protein ACWDO7_22905 [Streptomyces sp. NPDC003656]
MNTTTEAVALLKQTESYLAALHTSVARHDNLAANLGCAGCELLTSIRAALSAPTATARAGQPLSELQAAAVSDLRLQPGTFVTAAAVDQALKEHPAFPGPEPTVPDADPDELLTQANQIAAAMTESLHEMRVLPDNLRLEFGWSRG